MAGPNHDNLWFCVLWRNFGSSTMGCHGSSLCLRYISLEHSRKVRSDKRQFIFTFSIFFFFKKEELKVYHCFVCLFFFFFRLGAHYRSGEVGTEQDLQIERIISHHNYKRPYGMAHDIALLKLRKPAQINRAVNLACLPGSSGEVSDGKMCWVTGNEITFLKSSDNADFRLN